MDPDDAIEQLSLNALSEMSNSAFGSIAGPVVDAELVDVFGIGSSGSLASFMNKIQTALQTIETKLAGLQQSVASILAGVVVIEERIDDTEVQAMLLAFSQSSGVITEYFVTYSDALTAIASSDPKAQASGVADLYDLLSLDNAIKIATAMTAVQQSFVSSLSEQKGLIQYQTTIVQDAIILAATSTDFWTGNGYGPGSSVFNNAAGSGGIYDGSRLFAAMQSAARQTLDTQVAGTLKAFLTVSLQGLILLNAAWLHTGQEPQVATQVTAIGEVTKSMVAFGGSICQSIDDQVSSTLNTQAKRVIVADGMNWSTDNGVSTTGNNPYGSDWVQWQLVEINMFSIILQNPWTYPPPNPPFAYLCIGRDINNNNFVMINEMGNLQSPTVYPARYDPQKATSAFYSVLAPLS